MSIDSFSANFLAETDGLTWKPIIIALEAEAKRTSESVIWPTPLWITFTWIWSVVNFKKESHYLELGETGLTKNLSTTGG